MSATSILSIDMNEKEVEICVRASFPGLVAIVFAT